MQNSAASNCCFRIDKEYLEAEATWRAGNLDRAGKLLEGALRVSGGSKKYEQLWEALVRSLQASPALEEGKQEVDMFWTIPLPVELQDNRSTKPQSTRSPLLAVGFAFAGGSFVNPSGYALERQYEPRRAFQGNACMCSVVVVLLTHSFL